MSLKDERSHLRYLVQWEVEVSTRDWSDVLTLTTSSVSLGGMFVYSTQTILTGTELQVTLLLPNGQRASLIGEVVRIVEAEPSAGKRRGFAVRFNEDQSKDLVLLESMAKAHGTPQRGNLSDRSEPVRVRVILRKTVTEESHVKFERSTAIHLPLSKDSSKPGGSGRESKVRREEPTPFPSDPSQAIVPLREGPSVSEWDQEQTPLISDEAMKELDQALDALSQDGTPTPAIRSTQADSQESLVSPSDPELYLEYNVEQMSASAIAAHEAPGDFGFLDEQSWGPEELKPKPERVDNLGGTPTREGLALDKKAESNTASHLMEREPVAPKPRSRDTGSQNKSLGSARGLFSQDPRAMVPTSTGREDSANRGRLADPRREALAGKEREGSANRGLSPTVHPDLPAAEERLQKTALRDGERSPAGGARQSTPSPAIHREAQAFGIDFGTTYCSICQYTEGGLRVLHDDNGDPLIPSVVSYPEQGAPVVGRAARDRLATHPGSTFFSPKRMIGRDYDDPKVQPYIRATSVQTRRGPNGQIIAEIYGQPISLIQVCADIFRYVAQVGERRTNHKVAQVVLAAPVAFDEKQRQGITRAAQMAGLEVLGILDEPVGAAISFGVGIRDNELIAVYDFGGGTFDFTLLEVRERRFKVLSEAGDSWLGGDDFDLALANWAADQFWREHQVDLRKRQVEWQRLIFYCEEAKRRLSRELETTIYYPEVVLTSRGKLDLRIPLNRGMFLELCAELVDRSIETMDTAFSLTDYDRKGVHQVVMTGGVSRIPLVKQRVEEYFERKIEFKINPEQAIVLGAAHIAHQVAGMRRD